MQGEKIWNIMEFWWLTPNQERLSFKRIETKTRVRLESVMKGVSRMLKLVTIFSVVLVIMNFIRLLLVIRLKRFGTF